MKSRKHIGIFFGAFIIISLFSIYYILQNLESNNSSLIKEDAWIAGSILKSRTDGLLSSLFFTNMFSPQGQSHKKGKANTYKLNIELYKTGKPLDQKGKWITYKSALRSPSTFYVLADYFLFNFLGIEDNLTMFKVLSGIMFSIVLSFLVLWLYLEFGVFPAVVFLISIFFTPFLMNNVTLPLRASWIRFLPLVCGLWMLRKEEKVTGSISSLMIFSYVFLTIALAQSRSYEQTPIILISATLPFFYYGIKNTWSITSLFKRLAFVSVTCLTAFAFVLSLHIAVLSKHYKSTPKAIEYIEFSFLKRSHSSSEKLKRNVRPQIKRCLNTPTLRVLNDYLTEKNVVFIFTAKQLLISIFTLLLIFLLVNLKTKITSNVKIKQILGLFISVMLALIGVLVTLIIFKSHAACHKHIDFIFWCISFSFLSIILLSVLIKELSLSLWSGIKNN